MASSKLAQIMEHPDEFFPLVQMYLASKRAQRLPNQPDFKFCFKILIDVSRSFAMVVRQLPLRLEKSVGLFYLALRALDTIEDDMAIPVAEKVPKLLNFYKDLMKDDYKFVCGDGNYKLLMQNIHHLRNALNNIHDVDRDVILDITARMGKGMAEFIENDVETVDDYDQYCHYVAGLVGHGLSKLFVCSNLEQSIVSDDLSLANHMGLFLQKTNIIRDYLEDIQEIPAPRMFWPKEIWGKYATALDQLQHEQNRDNAVLCLNEMITNALTHVQYSLHYLSLLRTKKVLRFCAIPQIMAIYTLAECYNNPDVFTRVVKVRRGLTAKIFTECENMGGVYVMFRRAVVDLGGKCQSMKGGEEAVQKTVKLVDEIESYCTKQIGEWNRSNPMRVVSRGVDGGAEGDDDDQPIAMWVRVMMMFFGMGYFMYAFKLGNIREGMGLATQGTDWRVDISQRAIACVSLFFILLVVIRGRRI